MCLLLTLLAAVATTIVWHRNTFKPERKLEVLCLMYWGAGLMWTVDGFFRLAEGEPFFDLSANDALLGLVILLCGLGGWLLIRWMDRRKSMRATH